MRAGGGERGPRVAGEVRLTKRDVPERLRILLSDGELFGVALGGPATRSQLHFKRDAPAAGWRLDKRMQVGAGRQDGGLRP